MLDGEAYVRVGLQVVGADGEIVGVVKAVDAGGSLVHRRLRRDIWVPHYVRPRVEGERLVLPMAADQVDAMHWPLASLLGPP
jgi:hypothetical protein